MPQDQAGMESLPVALLLGAMLAASSVAIGAASVDRAERLSERGRILDSFKLFVERVRFLSAGGVGGIAVVVLDLGGCSIVADGRVVQLISGSSILSCEIVPLEMLTKGDRLGSGSYILEVKRFEDGSFVVTVEGL